MSDSILSTELYDSYPCFCNTNMPEGELSGQVEWQGHGHHFQLQQNLGLGRDIPASWDSEHRRKPLLYNILKLNLLSRWM